MIITLEGTWRLSYQAAGSEAVLQGPIQLPGTMQTQGYGDIPTLDTEWISGLHDTNWHLREEYSAGAGSVLPRFPFFACPDRVYRGTAWYEREFELAGDFPGGILRIELAKGSSSVSIDGQRIGGDFSLCAAHEISCGPITVGIHTITVAIDNASADHYRPDGHGVSDALGTGWNGMLGQIALVPAAELAQETAAKREYARKHPRIMEVRDGEFYIDGRRDYFRSTHFGGEFPLTGYPDMKHEKGGFWERLMKILKAWGLNGLRFHSLCPPEAAFAAADEAGICLLVECGMWNVFEEGIPMLDLLRQETRKILRQFGHHPSFVFFSPSNEPSGEWYEPLKQWVSETRTYDEELGYRSRRLYTAQSGWFYDVAPRDITGTDFIYFHRSADGPFIGGTIRNHQGWKGRDYRLSLADVKLPVICHELGQWCSYPDYSVKKKFTGFLKPGNYENFEHSAASHGLLDRNALFAWCSGKNQVMMYKEELEANFRTPGIFGFELLDLHDYLGQGGAFVGVLDAFWDEKGYVKAEEWRQFCNETVLLARFCTYSFRAGEAVELPLELCHFGKTDLIGKKVDWSFIGLSSDGEASTIWQQGSIIINNNHTPEGKNIDLGTVRLRMPVIERSCKARFSMKVGSISNGWDVIIYDGVEADTENKGDSVIWTDNWTEALEYLDDGGKVIFAPCLSELSYDCPPLQIRPVFWNGQMGPGWSRPLGMICENGYPVWDDFPTELWGGWQWEDILERARGFHIAGLEDQISPLVTMIDDWNRNLPLSLIFEAVVPGKRGTGKLLTVTADLSGSFAERPAAWTLRRALLNYAQSNAFEPTKCLGKHGLDILASRIMPNLLMASLNPRVTANLPHKTKLSNPTALYDGTPNTSVNLSTDHYPLSFTMEWETKVSASRLVYLAEQTDRLRLGDIKEYELYGKICDSWQLLQKGRLLSTWSPQIIDWTESYNLTGLMMVVLSGYGPPKTFWENRYDGWYQVNPADLKTMASLAILSLIPDRITEGISSGKSNRPYWHKQLKPTVKEIDG